MSKNIKDIGKELMGKSLNSFHRKTGLTQLEKNNKMQDGILNGILSQVDDAYIEKTEQSNVIHLDGSGDGVVVVDSIEGNTMVNLHPTDLKIGSGGGQDSSTTWHVGINMDKTRIKPNTYYTVFVLNSSSKVNRCYFNLCRKTVLTLNENKSSLFYTDDYERNIAYIHFYSTEPVPKSEVINTKIVVLEGDYTNCSINFIEGLQSSFEEKVNDEGKYEIEILSNNRNLVKNTDFKANGNGTVTHKASGEVNVKTTVNTGGITYKTDIFKVGQEITFKSRVRVNSTVNGTSCTLRIFNDTTKTWIHTGNNGVTSDCSLNTVGEKTLKLKVNLTESNYKNGDVLLFYISLGMNTTNDYSIDFDILKDGISIELGNTINSEILPHKQNKIKLLINEPLRAIQDVKDRLCIKDGKLVIKRNIVQKYYNGTQGEFEIGWTGVENLLAVDLLDFQNKTTKDFIQNIICDRFVTNSNSNIEGCYKYYSTEPLLSIPVVVINKNKLVTPNIDGFKEWLKNNPINVACVLEEPIYEEVLNEYGEPILLEGYENGTIYIDSTIVPTTTVRYTPKMESFNALKEVKIRNAINDFDVTENVIPYMMEVDMKLTELEMSAINTYNIKNIRKMEVLDMTSMQERTFKMLERLIRGKSHTKQELIDRVLLYEQAKRITTEQALELNLIIEEVYGA